MPSKTLPKLDVDQETDFYSPSKRDIYGRIFRSLRSLRDTPQTVLTFPGEFFRFEEELLDTYPGIQIVGLEQSCATYDKQRRKEMSKRISLLNISDYDHFKMTPDKYDFIWLDYCGNLNYKRVKGIVKAINTRSLRSKSILALTLCYGHDGTTRFREIYTTMAKRMYRVPITVSEARKAAITVAVHEELIKNNYNPRLVSSEFYRGSGKEFGATGQYMMFFLFIIGYTGSEVITSMDYDPVESGFRPFLNQMRAEGVISGSSV